MPELQGTVADIRHQTEPGQFVVFSLMVGGKAHAVSGVLHGLLQVTRGATLKVIGGWDTHPKYGRQFTASGWRLWAPTGQALIDFLRECVPGFVDVELCEALLAKYGEGLLERLLKDPCEAVDALASDHPKREVLQSALMSLERAQAISDLALFLGEFAINPKLVSRVFAAFELDSIRCINENPWRLVQVPGVSFSQADAVAWQLGFQADDPKRMHGVIFGLLTLNMLDGHLFIQRQNIAALASTFCEKESIQAVPDFEQKLLQAVGELCRAGEIHLDTTCGFYRLDQHQFEVESARKLAQFATHTDLDVDLESFLASYELAHQIELSEAQREAVHKLVGTRVLVLTGLPGTGKTTLVRTFVSLFKLAGIKFSLMAPTGIAAKRLGYLTGEPASTIHRALKYDGTSWGYDQSVPYSTGAVIVDECSMVDQELLYRLLSALDKSTILVLVGDDAQLPSVGPGNVLRELVACDLPTVRLTKIFRQAETSQIIVASHQINAGECPNVSDPESEFRFVAVPDADQIVALITEMAAKLKAKDANFQVLAPMYKGSCGVDRLNMALRDRLNPLKGQVEYGKGTFREGDRVMVVRNNYKLNVYNGDMGKLMHIGPKSLTVRIHGVGGKEMDTYIEFPRNEVYDHLKLAYAITSHKSQGSEWDTIIFPMVQQHWRMLQRNLFYTVVTRARKKVWVLGELAAMRTAIDNNSVVHRRTILGRRVRESIAEITDRCSVST